jgi:hypothetical protein
VYKEYYKRQRRRIFELFWSLESYVRKTDFVISRVEEKKRRIVRKSKKGREIYIDHIPLK